MNMKNETGDFANIVMLRLINRDLFRGRIFIILIGYIGITLLLNAIRTTAPLWFVWVLIVIQLLLYFSIFYVSYTRAVFIGLNKYFGFILFIVLATLGRVNDWELFIIPSLLIVMFIFSERNTIPVKN